MPIKKGFIKFLTFWIDINALFTVSLGLLRPNARSYYSAATVSKQRELGQNYWVGRPLKTNKGRPIAAGSLPVRPNFCGRDLRHIERFFKTLFKFIKVGKFY